METTQAFFERLFATAISAPTRSQKITERIGAIQLDILTAQPTTDPLENVEPGDIQTIIKLCQNC